MAAYGAAVSLLNTLSKLNSNPHTLIAVLLEEVHSLKCFLVDNREVKREFEIQIRDAIYEAQDMIDSHISSTHFLSPSEAETTNKSFYGDLERVIQKIKSIAEMTMEEFYHQTLDRKISASVWRSSDEINCLKRYPVVGRDKDINKLKDRLMKGSDGLQVVPIVGIAGMGKSTLAHCLLQDLLINEHFDAICWVKVSLKYDKHDKLLNLLASLKKSSSNREEINEPGVEYLHSWSDEIHQKTNEQLEKLIYNSLKHKRYLILLDDIRNVAAWNDFKELFPNYSNGSRILLTTRNVDVAPVRHPHLLGRLSDEGTMTLLENIVFDGESCPAHLLVIAKDIVQSCRGLPHAVVIVGKLLSCANPLTEYWEIVLSSIDTCENYGDCLEALVSLTYDHLPPQLRVCLLYMAILPYNYAILCFKLMVLWAVEGFVEEGTNYSNFCSVAQNCLDEILRRGFLLVLLNDREFLFPCVKISEEVFHDFLVRKAKTEKFFLVISKDTIDYGFLRGDTSYNQQRRLCIQQNIHRFIKDLSECNLNSSARSLVYFGSEPQYRIQAWPEDFKLLEVLDALKIGFYTFPPEFLKLVQLKYLAFSYNRQLPEAVNNFRKLQVLIVSQYLNLKCYGVPSYLPIEIWNLKDLIHLQVEGNDLPEPPFGSNLHLENLHYLFDVSARSCTRTILERIKNIWILEVQIQSPPEEDELLGFFSYLDILNRLITFKCVVMYPDIGPQVRPFSFLAFPSGLKFLTLSGCGFPWEYMRGIAALPNLKFLKLQRYAFQGPEWEVKQNEFPKLTHLSLEDMDFENWTFSSSITIHRVQLPHLGVPNC